VIVDAAHYRAGHREPDPFELDGALAWDRRSGSFSWIGLYEPDEAEFDAVRNEYDLHELAVEDAVKAHQRPKLERYDETLFVVLKPAIYDDTSETVEFGEIHLFINDFFAVVVRHRRSSQLVDVRRSLEADVDTLRLGPGSVLHAIIEHVVDNYLVVLDGLELDIAQVEGDVFADSDVVPTERIYRLLRQVINFSQATIPLVEPLDRLSKGSFVGVHSDLREYFRDTHDLLIRVIDRINALRQLLTSILDANLTQVTVRQNNDMRKISAWVAIAAVPTLLAGVWGMNFDSMPELSWNVGYPLAILVMVAISGFLYRRFKASGWL